MTATSVKDMEPHETFEETEQEDWPENTQKKKQSFYENIGISIRGWHLESSVAKLDKSTRCDKLFEYVDIYTLSRYISPISRHVVKCDYTSLQCFLYLCINVPLLE